MKEGVYNVEHTLNLLNDGIAAQMVCEAGVPAALPSGGISEPHLAHLNKEPAYVSIRYTNSGWELLHSILVYELTKVGSDQRSSTIQYDSKSKHSKRRQTVN